MAKLFRLLQVYWILMRFGLDQILFATPRLLPLRFLSKLNPWNWFRKPVNRAQRVRLAFESLGPLFIKFGQILSTRADILPADIIQELTQLQDKVPPFCGKRARTMVASAYDKPLEELFKTFNETPIASASIAQVHAVQLLDGTPAVAKILRPNIKKLIARDLKVLEWLAKLACCSTALKHFKPRAMVDELKFYLTHELDFLQEAANASQLRRNSQGSPELYIPEVYWQYTNEKVLVLEKVQGLPIADQQQLKTHSINTHKLAINLVTCFFNQVFNQRFFHGDLHPGNLFVDATEPDAGKIIAVDFGAAGSLDAHDQRYIAENLLAFLDKDYHRVAMLHITCGWVPADTRVDYFESAIRKVSEPILDRPIKDISFAQMLVNLLHCARQFNMQIQPQLILLQKALLNIEGLGRQLDPDLNLFEIIRPILEKWLKSRKSVRNTLKKIKEELPTLLTTLPELNTNLKLLQNQLTQNKPAHKSLLIRGIAVIILIGLAYTLPVTKLSFLLLVAVLICIVFI